MRKPKQIFPDMDPRRETGPDTGVMHETYMHELEAVEPLVIKAASATIAAGLVVSAVGNLLHVDYSSFAMPLLFKEIPRPKAEFIGQAELWKGIGSAVFAGVALKIGFRKNR